MRLRQNVQWKKLCVTSNDQYIVFADIINKITRSTGKVSAKRETCSPRTTHLCILFPLSFQIVPILMALSTSSMLLLDQRTLQIKYRIPATEIYRLSLSPFHDNIAVFHVKAVSDFVKCFWINLFDGISWCSLFAVGSRTQKRWFCISNCTRHRSDYEIIFGCTKCNWPPTRSLYRLRVRSSLHIRIATSFFDIIHFTLLRLNQIRSDIWKSNCRSVIPLFGYIE